jgi:hypothetical protein
MKPLRSQSGRKGHPLATSFGGSLLQRHPHRQAAWRAGHCCRRLAAATWAKTALSKQPVAI